MTIETVRCPTHGIDVPKISVAECVRRGLPIGCTPCREAMFNGRDVSTMTADERVKEMYDILGPCFAGIDAVHFRLDQLVGRPTFTHEMAYPEYLEHEIKTGSVPTMDGVIAKLPHDKPVVVIHSDGSSTPADTREGVDTDER